MNGYFVVQSTENGVLWHTDMSMEQGWEMHFSGYLGTPKPKIFSLTPNTMEPPGDTMSSK